jgi:hypothetical protein
MKMHDKELKLVDAKDIDPESSNVQQQNLQDVEQHVGTSVRCSNCE